MQHQATVTVERHPYMPLGLLGLMVPYGNFAMEWEMSVALREEHLTLVTRLQSSQSGDIEDRLKSYFDRSCLTQAFESFGSSPLECIGVACTATSYFIGLDEELRIFDELTNAHGVRFVCTAEAIRQALVDLGAKTFNLISPYSADITERCVQYWTRQGYAIHKTVRIESAAAGFHPIYGITPALLQQHLDEMLKTSSLPVVITGTGLSSLPPIMNTLKKSLEGPPVLSGNLCLLRCMVQSIDSESSRAEDWFTPRAHWLKTAANHPRMQRFLHA